MSGDAQKKLLPGFAQYWMELFQSEEVGNSPYLSPERVLMRMKHLDASGGIVPDPARIYEGAIKAGHPSATLPADELFAAFARVEG